MDSATLTSPDSLLGQLSAVMQAKLIRISFACITAESCPNRLSGEVKVAESISIQCKILYVFLDNITNGVKAELIHADSGALLGIRVSWSWL